MKVFLSAGEASGDRFAAELAGALKAALPQAACCGIGSVALAAAGVRLLLDVSATASIGLTEALATFPRSLRLLRRARRLLRAERPDVFVPVDCQGYNLPLARAAKRAGIPVLWYIPPQEFLWDGVRAGRRTIARADLLLCVYRQAETFYNNLGGNAVFVGHPLAGRIGAPVPQGQPRRVVLAPGARRQELARLLPPLLQAARLLGARHPELVFQAAAVDAAHGARLAAAAAAAGVALEVCPVPLGEILSGAALYLGKSGTASLEAALAGVPSVLLYKISRTSYFLFSKVLGLGRRLTAVGLPNLLLGRQVVPELLQRRATGRALFMEACPLLEDAAARQAQGEAFRRLAGLLGEPGAAVRAAQEVARLLHGRTGCGEDC